MASLRAWIILRFAKIIKGAKVFLKNIVSPIAILIKILLGVILCMTSFIIWEN